MKRMGMVIGIKPEKIEDYKRMHDDVWPEVLDKLSDCNIHNYTIFLREPENLLFGYWEYHGTDFSADYAKLLAHPRSQEWSAIIDPGLTQMDNIDPDVEWSMLEEVFHCD